MVSNPIDGPFPPGWQLTDYSDEEGYGIPPRDVAHRDAASDVMDRLDRARKAAA